MEEQEHDTGPEAVATELAWSPDPTVDEMIGGLLDQISDLTVRLMAANLSLGKALNRVRELEQEKSDEREN